MSDSSVLVLCIIHMCGTHHIYKYELTKQIWQFAINCDIWLFRTVSLSKENVQAHFASRVFSEIGESLFL